MQSFDLEYRDNQISVAIDDHGIAHLSINGMQRDSRVIPDSGGCLLSSSVQTDYEWHEFIEARVNRAEGPIHVAIKANGSLIGEQALDE